MYSVEESGPQQGSGGEGGKRSKKEIIFFAGVPQQQCRAAKQQGGPGLGKAVVQVQQYGGEPVFLPEANASAQVVAGHQGGKYAQFQPAEYLLRCRGKRAVFQPPAQDFPFGDFEVVIGKHQENTGQQPGGVYVAGQLAQEISGKVKLPYLEEEEAGEQYEQADPEKPVKIRIR